MKLSELEALARAATPGEWKHGPGSTMISTRPVPDAQNCSGFSLVCRSGIGVHSRDAAFIVAANPQTILKLCQLLRDACDHDDAWLEANGIEP